MPEYLSPGVFIEEVPSGLRAIEGVSTSTAAFVGRARRGSVAGAELPFTPTGDFVLTPDPAPVLVTSFAQFRREFGPPLPISTPGDPSDYGYLGWAVRAFFDNGGRRVYIARVVNPPPADESSTVSVSQGVVYRLMRAVDKLDTTIFLTSTRGLNAGDTLKFKRHSDGLDALGTPDQPAEALGGKPAFALKSGDSLKVTDGGGPAVTGTWTAKSATVRTKPGTTTFPNLLGTTLDLQAGRSNAPHQLITFTSDPITPLSTPPTLNEVASFLSRFADGVHVFIDAAANELVMETDGAGKEMNLVIDATAVTNLNLAPVTPGDGNVADIDHVTIEEIKAQLAGINVKPHSTGKLCIFSTDKGPTATIKVEEATAGSGVLKRLGYTANPTTASGLAGITPPTIKVVSYDAATNSVKLSAAPGVPLDPSDVSVTGSTSLTESKGPKFIARSPGSWGNDVRIIIMNSDRQMTAIQGSGIIPAGAIQVKVQNVSSLYVGAAVEIDYGTKRTNHQITGIDAATRQITIEPATANPITPADTGGPSLRVLEIDIIVTDTSGVGPTEVYRGLSWHQSPGVTDVRRHYASQINARSRLVWVNPPTVEEFKLTSQPITGDGFPMPLSGGTESFDDGDAICIGVDNGPGARSGIESLKDLTEARIIAAPGKTSPAVQLALITQCELLRYRFAILDGQQDPAGGSITSILGHRNLYDTSFAAYYTPWVTVTVDGHNRNLPPSGYLAGVYARVDNSRGVWKAPANESVLNVLSLKTNFTTGEQDLLNPRGVNLIRQFDVGGVRVWGARTLSSDPDVKYINVRRTLIFLEASIDRGTQWVVFEPNTPDTWMRVTDSVSAFLLTQWRSGALFGRKPEQAFFVRCDESTMTADDILNGRLICEIGVAIVRPAEFVIFRIEQITNFGATQ